jgi:hypothetical protein
MAIGQTIAGVDPKAAKEERNHIVDDLKLLDQKGDYSNYTGEDFLHDIHYKIRKTDKIPFSVTIAHLSS